MRRQIQLLRQLLLDSQYVVDPAAVADAILARASARRAIRGTAFRNDVRGSQGPQVRSFRPTRQARSFKPCSAQDGLISIVPTRRA
jgi:hypothetical protein